MDNRQVAHRWAQQSGRDATGSNFYSRGDTIYSYGHHFPIAKFFGLNVVLLTNRTYSTSTARHCRYVRWAIPDRCRIFTVRDVTAETKTEHKANFLRLKSEALAIIADLPRLRARKAGQIEAALRIVELANEYAAHFKLGQRIRLKGTTEVELRQLYSEQVEKDNAAQKKRQAETERRRIAHRAKAQETLADWLKGGTTFPEPAYLDQIRFRLIGNGETLQSTLGAEFPTEHARRAWPMLQRIKATGQEWRRNGLQIHLGHFSIDAVEHDGTVRAGCHSIRWEEIERIAALLKLDTKGANQ